MQNRNYPIDREIELVRDKRIISLKFLSFNEPIFEEHFPDMSIYPGSMIMNTVASSLESLIQNSNYKHLNTVPIEIKTAKFRKACLPGDLLKVEINLKNIENKIYKFSFQVNEYFNGDLVCNGQMMIKAV
ncbi:hypothetical protein [Lysinibacillus sp. Bpr_S20]|uniref:3-hydroxyacyl-ACP dehydratase FabZ family protein n=1 Tax=Lysinibacillus sp. Bpr_S20 TaxID=2933964 RepID=UPI00201229FF|nr:hypothetical protein [Lysinibacillus sp. Bpr_S20]MCL1702978.1 hypothetical protein [Lysinibacillus sp. Bpr_S20]